MPDSYKNAKQLQNYCLMGCCDRILRFDVPKPEHEKIGAISNSELESYYQALLKHDSNKVFGILEAIYGKDYDCSCYASDYLQSASLRLSFALADAVRYLHLDGSRLLMPADLLYKKLASFRSRAALYQWMRETIAAFFGLESLDIDTNSPIVIRMRHYIETHYQEDISLKSISFALNTNTAYLGSVFKTATGQAFSIYLNKLRIESSKTLLNESNATVHEIARKVGYNSTNHFVNTFKKYTGCFPSQYRSLHNG